jgi:thiosulfate dehydrogenase [quinone] large subunit
MRLPALPSIPLIHLWPLRIWVGLSFVLAGENKISRGGLGTEYASGVEGFVNGNLENAYAFYRPFLESVVLPNTGTFAALVAWGELLFGLSVLLGLFTRLGAAVGIFIIFNYTFTTGRGIWLPGMDAAYIWALFTLLVAGAGRVWGLDQLLRDKWGVKLLT